MLIFVYGDDAYRAKQHVDAMVARFDEKYDPSGMNRQIFVADKSLALGDVAQAIQTPPFLGEKRMVVIRQLLQGVSKNSIDAWQDLLSRIPSDTIVIIQDDSSEKAALKHALVKVLSGSDDTHTYTFSSLSGQDLHQFAQQEATRIGLSITDRQLRQVTASTGEDTWRLRLELRKLADWGAGEALSDEALTTLIAASHEDQLFALMDAMSAKQQAKAMKLLVLQRLHGSSDEQIFSMLARQIRLLIAGNMASRDSLSQKEFAKLMSIHPFVAKKSMAQGARFDTDLLLRLHDLSYQFDGQIKTGSLDAASAVDRLILGFLSDETIDNFF